MNSKDKKLLAKLAYGAKLIFDNAEALYREAELLGTNGHFARALTLHQISMEECSKVDILGAAAMSLLMGHPVNLDKLMKRLTQHRVKNYNNAYMSLTTDAERDARKSGDHKRAMEIFRAQQEEIHHFLDGNKNASLYVDYRGGKFSSPSEVINEDLAVQMQRLNGFYLANGSNHIRLLGRMQSESDTLAEQATDFLSRTEALKEVQPSELDATFQEMFQEWVKNLR